MDKNTVVGKTAKGLREASGKTSLLTRDTRDLLKDIDGHLSIGALLRRLPDWSEEEMSEAVTLLLKEEFVRDLTLELPSHEVAPRAVPPPRTVSAPAPKPLPAEQGEELDFTAMMAAEEATKQAIADAAKREAEEQARREAEAKTQAAAEEHARAIAKAKAAAEAQAKAVAEAQAKAAAEAKAKAEAQAKAAAQEQARQQAAAEQAKRDATEAAKKAAEGKAKQEAEAQAQREAEAKATAEAQARAAAEAQAKSKAAAEAQARAAADAKAKAEAQAKAVAQEHARQQEAEAQARREAEAKAQAAAAAQAQAKVEAEAKAKAAAQAKDAADEHARQQAAAEAARRAAEEQARRDAEEKARRDAEEKARRDAGEKAQRDAAERDRREAEEKLRREAEERAERAAEELARLNAAEEPGRRVADERARQRVEAEAAADIETPVAEEKARAPRSPAKWIKAIALLLLLAVGAGVGLIHVISFDGQKAQLEMLASAQFGQPVTIRSVGMAILPQPHWRIEGVVIGADKQLSAPQIKLLTSLGGLLGSARTFQSMHIESPTVTTEGLGWLLFGKAAGAEIKLGKVGASGVRLELQGFALPAVSVAADVGDDGNWRTLSAQSADRKFGVELQSAGATVEVELKVAALTLLTAAAPAAIEDVVATGSAAPGGFDIKAFKARVAGGNVSGKARLKWAAMNVEGELAVGQIDVAQLFAGFMERGRLDGKANFVLPLQAGDKSTAMARLEGNFSVDGGVIAGIDLGRTLQGGGAGGQTQFTRMSGSVSHQDGKTQVRGLRIDAGKLSANGTADVDQNANLRGQLGVELDLGGERRRAGVAVAGPFKAPYKNIEWSRR